MCDGYGFEYARGEAELFGALVEWIKGLRGRKRSQRGERVPILVRAR